MSERKNLVGTEGQRYVDEPVYVEVSRAKTLALAINECLPRHRGVPTVQPRIETISHFERVQLRWLTPDGKGGLVQRK